MVCSQIVYLCFFYLFISISESQDAYESKYGYEDTTDTVYLEQSPGNDHEQFPITYAVWFEHEGQRLFFDLIRDDTMTSALNPSVFKLANFLPDDLMTEHNDQEFAYYHNGEPTGTESRSCFVLHRPSPDQKANLYGQIRDDGDNYLLQHLVDNEHSITRDLNKVHSRKRREIIPGTTNIVEIFLWSAPGVFKFHRSRLGVNARETEEFLRIWERAIIRDVDVIFREVTSTPFRAYFLGGGNDRDSSVAWYSDNTRGGVLREAALADVSAYLSGLVQSDLIPFYDHAVVLTRQDVAETYRRGADRIALGVADSICGYPPGSSVSIAEVSSPFFAKAVAQSILFAFGLPYDTLDNTYTVMSRDVLIDIPVENRAGRWTIDNRSQNLLKNKIDDLLFNCLIVENGNFDFEAFLATPPYGQAFSRVRDQCQIFAGPNSRECRPMDTVCYDGVMCLDANGDCTLDYFTGHRTPCGVIDQCRQGDCTALISTTTPKGQGSSSTTLPSTTTIPSTTTLPSTTTPQDCCCERRPLGKVVIKMEYVPCTTNRNRYYYSP